EACLAKLAAERRGSVMPQRYAVLAIKWKQALSREQAQPEPSAPVAPWMTAATNTAPYAVPAPDRLAVELTDVSGPVPAKPAVKPETRSPTFLYGLPVDDDDDDDVQAEPPSSAEPPPSAEAPPVEFTSAESSPSSSLGLPVDDDDEATTASPVSTPTVVARPPEPAPASDEDAPTRRPGSRVAEPRPSASLAERLDGPRSLLEQATERDQATDALV